MENKVRYIQAMNSINLYHTQYNQETQKIRQNPEKFGYDSLQGILIAEFHFYDPKCKSHYFRSFINHQYISRCIKGYLC